jgi:glycopeptide antibiotics resistance protein
LGLDEFWTFTFGWMFGILIGYLIWLVLLFSVSDTRSFDTSAYHLSCLGLSPFGILARDTPEPIERFLTFNSSSMRTRILFIKHHTKVMLNVDRQ